MMRAVNAHMVACGARDVKYTFHYSYPNLPRYPKTGVYIGAAPRGRPVVMPEEA